MGGRVPVKIKPVKVSVVIPAYNAERTIERALRSVLAQKGVSFEVLIGDDASTDDTLLRLKPYASDPRVRIFRFRKNRGASATGNRLIARARGRYISSCDADDKMLPGNLKTFSRILDRNPKAGVAYGDLKVVMPNGRSWIKRRLALSKSWELLGGCLANGGTMIRRNLILKVGGYREDLPVLEDCDLFLRLSEITSFYALAGKPLYIQNKTSGSLSVRYSKQIKKISRSLLRRAIQRRYGVRAAW